MDYPSNSYTHRGKMKVAANERPQEFQNDLGHYYVRLKVTVWPEIYGDELPIHFPTEAAALRFAQCNISPTTILARVYTPSGILIASYGYTVHGVSLTDHTSKN